MNAIKQRPEAPAHRGKRSPSFADRFRFRELSPVQANAAVSFTDIEVHRFH
jgi:hypothetical protein